MLATEQSNQTVQAQVKDKIMEDQQSTEEKRRMRVSSLSDERARFSSIESEQPVNIPLKIKRSNSQPPSDQ